MPGRALPDRSRRARLGAAALVAAIALVAVGLRCAGWRDRLERPGWARVADPDAAYHLRRAERIRDGFPTLAIRDPFLDAPRGAAVPWPPLWDLTLAGALGVAPADPANGAVRAAVALLPPLLLGLAVVAIHALARRLDPGRAAPAAVAAGVAALAVADRPWTGFAQLDHGAAELLAATVFLAALARALERAPTPGALVDRRGLVPGLVLGVGLCTQAALLPLAMVPLAATALARRGAPWSDRLRTVAAVWGAAGAVTLPFALAYAVAGAGFDPWTFGLFQPALLGVAAALAWGGAGVVAARSSRERIAATAAIAAGAVAAVALVPALGGGLGFLTRESPWVASIAESRSPFAGGPGAGLAAWIREISWLAVLVPFGAVALGRRARSGEGAAAVACAGLLVAAVLAAAQTRFVGHLSLLAGVAAVAATRRWLVLPRSAAARAAAAALLLAPPALGPARRPPLADQPEVALAEAREPLAELRRRAEGTGEAARGVVLAEWSFGHFIQYHGRHPAVVDNFGDAVGDLDFPRRVLLATDEAEAEPPLESRRVRYLLVGGLGESFTGLLPTPADRDRFVADSRLGDRAIAVAFRPAMAETILFRAVRLRGAGAVGPAGELVAPLRGWRLVAESAATEATADGGASPRYRLFERVAGARLRAGGMPPASPARLEAELLTARGEELRWVDAGTTDARGEVEFRFPYATDAPALARPLAVRIVSGDAEAAVREIPEDAVLAGKTIAVAALSRAGSRGPG